MSLLHRKFPIWLFALVCIVVLAIAALVGWRWTTAGRTHVTAYFDTSVGVSPGTDVRVLGVSVGTVDEVTPKGDLVEVRLHVNRGVQIPAEAKAAQITPSVVPDRYVQLLPAYTGGPEMENGAVIPRERTTTPVEVDRLYQSLSDLTEALGPEGANKDGSLSRTLDVTAETLAGNGEALGRSIADLSGAARTLSDNRQNLASTVVDLQSFVSMLAENDQQVRTFNQQLATFTDTVATQRYDLQEALNQVSLALADVGRLVRDNQDVIQANADRLATLGTITADHQDDIADILIQAPNALTNLIEAYDAESGTLQMRLALPELQSPAEAICKMMQVSRLQPGNPLFADLEDQAAIDACRALIEERNGQLKQAAPDLPFGILEGELAQSVPQPGTVGYNEGFTRPPASERSPR